MNAVQTFILAACCVFSAFSAYLMFRGGGSVGGSARVVTVTNYVGSASAAVSKGATAPNVEWSPVVYGCAGNLEWCYVNGCLYKKGFRTDKGMVVELNKDFVHLMGDNGDYWIFHRDAGLGGGRAARPLVAGVAKKEGVKND